METWIRRACRRCSYRQFITWVVLTIGAIAAAFGAQTYWENFFHGPFQLTLTDLNRSIDSEHEFVALTGTKVVDSGVNETTTETNNGVKGKTYVSSSFWLLLVGDKIVVVKRGKEPPLHIEGVFKPYPAGLPQTIFPDAADADLRQRIYPEMLDTEDPYRLPGYITFGAVAVWCFLLWRFALPAYREIQEITLHPVVKRVESWADSIEAMHEAELQLTTGLRFKKSGIVVTDDYVVVRTFYSFNLFPLNHLLWAYRKATTRMVNFIPVARTSEAILIFYGGSASFPSRKKLVEEVLLYAAHRAPWAILGYSSELAHAFKKDTNNFVAAVEARRAELIG